MRIIVDSKGQRIVAQAQPQMGGQTRQAQAPQAPTTTQPQLQKNPCTATPTNNRNNVAVAPAKEKPKEKEKEKEKERERDSSDSEERETDSESEDDKDLTSDGGTTGRRVNDRERRKKKGQNENLIQDNRRHMKRAKTKQEEGYNSSDERNNRIRITSSHAVGPTAPENEKAFEEQLKKKGFIIIRMLGDGNCLFRAVAHQVYGDAEMHDEVRKRCLEYMEKERDHYSQFLAEPFEEYVSRKKKDRCYGNNTEIQAIAEIFNRPVEVFSYGQTEPINIFHNSYTTDNPAIRLSYHHGNHYNSVIDPKNPSVGVGLGLPGLQPGLADKLQVEKAMEESVTAAIEKSIMDESKQEADWAVTQQELEEAIMRQSEQDYWNTLIEQQMLGETEYFY